MQRVPTKSRAAQLIRSWGLLGLICGGLFCTSPSLAQGIRARSELRIERVDLTKKPRARLYVSDLDASKRPITDRPRKAYRLLVDGVPHTHPIGIESREKSGEPFAVGLIVQVSPALKDVHLEVVEGLKRLVKSLSGSKVGLVAYTDVTVTNIKPTKPNDILGSLDELRIREESVTVELLNAVKDSLEGLGGKSLPKQRLIVIVSDGLNSKIETQAFSDLGHRASDKNITIHTIGYAKVEAERLRRTLYELSRRSRGTFRAAKNSAEINKAFRDLQDEIHNQRILTYDLRKFFDGKLHALQIEFSSGGGSNEFSREFPKMKKGENGEEKEPEKTSGWAIFALVAGGIVLLTISTLVALQMFRSRTPPPPVKTRAYDDEDDDDEEQEDDEEDDDEEDAPHDIGDRTGAGGRDETRNRREMVMPQDPHSTIDQLFSGQQAAYPDNRSQGLQQGAWAAPDPRSHPTQAPDPRSHATQAPDPRSHATQAPDPRSHATQAPDPRSYATQAPDPRSHGTPTHATPGGAPSPSVYGSPSPMQAIGANQSPGPHQQWAIPSGAPMPQAPSAGAPFPQTPYPGGPSPMGQPAMGQPAMGQPAMQPAMGQPAMGQPAMGQPAMGQPAMGQPAMGQPAMGQPPMAPMAPVMPQDSTVPPPDAGFLPLPDPDSFVKSAGERGGPRTAERPAAPNPMAPPQGMQPGMAPASPMAPMAPSMGDEVPTSPVNDAFSIPDPEEFMRQAKPGEHGSPSIRSHGPTMGGAAANSIPGRAAALPQSMHSPTGLPGDLMDMPQQSASVGGSGIPLSMPVSDDVEQRGRMLDRKTMVMAAEDLGGPDFVAWVATIDNLPNSETYELHDNYIIGTDPTSNLRLQEPGVAPRHATFRIDSRGFVVHTDDGEQTFARPLNDSDVFEVGPRRFVYKMASRFPTKQLAAARIEVLNGMDHGRNIGLQPKVAYVIGAHSDCDLVIRGHGVSNRHAVVLQKGRQCVIGDLGAESGIVIDDEQIGRRALNPGDKVLLGDIWLVYTLDDQDELQGLEDEQWSSSTAQDS
jgi:pSer/pThr/pTyr-binding forkhead associated (FHA) protein